MRFFKRTHSEYVIYIKKYMESNITANEICQQIGISMRTFFRHLKIYKEETKEFNNIVKEYKQNQKGGDIIVKEYKKNQKNDDNNTKQIKKNKDNIDKKISVVSINDEIDNLNKYKQI